MIQPRWLISRFNWLPRPKNGPNKPERIAGRRAAQPSPPMHLMLMNSLWHEFGHKATDLSLAVRLETRVQH